MLSSKTDWQESTKDTVDENGNIINKEQVRKKDPKIVFLIGNKYNEFNEYSINKNDIIKRDTFERFRRNNKNVDIVTYDELFERAYYLLHDKVLEKENLEKIISSYDDDEIPF